MKKIWFFSLLSMIFTILWLVLLFVSMNGNGQADTLEQAVTTAVNGGWLIRLTFLNAFLLTVTVTILFICLFNHFREVNREWSYIGIVFVPVYCVLNILVYLSQITVVPRLAALMVNSDEPEVYRIILGQFVQGWSGSMISVINLIAYMILGIPSIIFGILMVKDRNFRKASGWLFVCNAAACIAGGIGTIFNNFLTVGSLIGGVLFLLALVFIVLTTKPFIVSFTTNKV